MAEKTKTEEKAADQAPRPAESRHRLIPVALVVLLLVFMVAGSLAYLLNTKDPDCEVLTKEATSLIKAKDFEVAYDKLQPHAEACGSPDSKLVKDNKAKLEYDFRLAVSAYQSGNKEDAKKAAQQGLDVSKQINNGVPSDDKDQQSLAFDLITITEGKYYNYRDF